jgi:hypothetical protein
VVCKGETTRRN